MKNDPTALAAATGSVNRNEVLNKLLLNADNENNNHLQPNDPKHNIKVAFAEGYLAANNSADGKTGFAGKFFKVSGISSRIQGNFSQRTICSCISDLYASYVLSGGCGPINIIVFSIKWLYHQVGCTHLLSFVCEQRFNVDLSCSFQYQVEYSWVRRSR